MVFAVGGDPGGEVCGGFGVGLCLIAVLAIVGDGERCALCLYSASVVDGEHDVGCKVWVTMWVLVCGG